MDESISFGTIGRTGKGVTEHYGISVRDYTMRTSFFSLSVITGNPLLFMCPSFDIIHIQSYMCVAAMAHKLKLRYLLIAEDIF